MAVLHRRIGSDGGVQHRDPKAVTNNFEPGDIGYIECDVGNHIGNVVDTDLLFLEVFKTASFRNVPVGLARPHARRPWSPLIQRDTQRHRQVAEQRPRRRAGLSPRPPDRDMGRSRRASCLGGGDRRAKVNWKRMGWHAITHLALLGCVRRWPARCAI